MLVSERAPFPVVTHIGVTGLAGYLIPTFILLCGVMLWFVPIAWIYYSILTIVLALASWITSNLGGFFIGMLIDIVGGALAFAWTTDADYGSCGWIRGELRIGLPSWARGLYPSFSPAIWPDDHQRRSTGSELSALLCPPLNPLPWLIPTRTSVLRADYPSSSRPNAAALWPAPGSPPAARRCPEVVVLVLELEQIR